MGVKGECGECALPSNSPSAPLPSRRLSKTETFGRTLEPLLERTEAVVGPTVRRSANVTRHPSQALRLLRLSAGACRGEFVQDATPPSAFSSELSRHTGSHLRCALIDILQTPVTGAVWTQVMAPLRLGGVGLRIWRHPVQRRLAAVINQDFALPTRTIEAPGHPQLDVTLWVCGCRYQSLIVGFRALSESRC